MHYLATADDFSATFSINFATILSLWKQQTLTILKQMH